MLRMMGMMAMMMAILMLRMVMRPYDSYGDRFCNASLTTPEGPRWLRSQILQC